MRLNRSLATIDPAIAMNYLSLTDTVPPSDRGKFYLYLARAHPWVLCIEEGDCSTSAIAFQPAEYFIIQ